MRKTWHVVALLGVMCAGCLVTMLGVVASVSGSPTRGGNTLVVGASSVVVESLKESQRLGLETAGSSRSFYVLQIRVGNGSRNRSFEFDPHMILVRSLSGGKAVRSSRGQMQEGMAQATVPPSTVKERSIVFEGPNGIKRMSVRFNTLGGRDAAIGSLFGATAQLILDVK